MNNLNRLAFGLFPIFALASAVLADPITITVQADKPGAKINPNFYGLMTEEINHSYDGGLYGELIQNRIFKDTLPPPRGRRGGAAAVPATMPAMPLHWSVIQSDGAAGTAAIDTNNPVNTTALTLSLRLDISSAGAGKRVGVANDGFWGIPVRPNTQYQASFYARGGNNFKGPLTVDIESNNGQTIYAKANVDAVTADWQKYSLTFKTPAVQPTADARFVISAENPGSVWFSLVSLFPPTYDGRANGNRPDIMQLLANMTPTFLRFPGGNYVEGNSFDGRFAWKNTVGPLEDRPGHMGPWSYRSSDGLGLLEFLEWCEDLKMEPLLAVYDGLQLDGGRTTITGDALKPFVQEALDEIEYVSGGPATPFGAARVKDGHPKPFKLHYVEIGNEDNLNNGAASYDDRFTMFHDAIKAKYPDLQLISTVPSSQRNPAPRGGREAPATIPSLYTRTRRPDLIDDHYYLSIPAMLANVHHYDKYDRSAPKIFVGEWATRVGDPTPTFGAAIADAAWLTGLERNADVIMMNCYAPLFVNVNPGAKQWATDLIGYDTLNSYGSPSYYAQKMFSNNRGDEVLPTVIDNVPMLALNQLPALPRGTRAGGFGREPASPLEGFFATASRQDSTGDIILKIVNMQSTAQTVNFDLQGAATVNAKAQADVLLGQPNDVNSIAEPTKVAPQQVTITDAAPKFSHEIAAYSVSVIRLNTK